MNNNTGHGSKTWYIADGWIPLKSKTADTGLEGHEALIILNYQKEDAEILLDIFFEDKDPINDIRLKVPRNRVRCFRMDSADEIGGVVIDRHTQYALRIKSNVEVIVQFGRMDVTQDNLAYVGLMGFPG